MRIRYSMVSRSLLVASALLAVPFCAVAQRQTVVGVSTIAELPDAPRPQFEIASAEPPAQPPTTEKSQHDEAGEQLKEQEKPRVFAFNVSYHSDAASLTAGQKMIFALRSSISPLTFAKAFAVAGLHEAMDDNKGFGWGAEGYGKLSGAAYLDSLDRKVIGKGILPSILHQEPRYFRLGHGSFNHRVLYSLATNILCKHDNSNRWEPNYSNVLGDIAASAISNNYYPSKDSGIGSTIASGLIATAEGGIDSIFHEFWPDVSRIILHRDPTHGLDAQAQAQDAAKKQQR